VSQAGSKEIIMVELSKSAKIRMLVVGLLLVKLALLLLYYHPVLDRSPSPTSPPLEATRPHLSSLQAPETPAELQRPAAGLPQVDAATAEPGRADNPPSAPPWESVKQLAAALERQRAALAIKEAQLRQREEQLEMLKASLRDQLEELAAARTRISEAVKRKNDLEEEELKRLARVYEATTPEQSSVLLGKLEAKLAARILSRMNGAKAGKVLSSMEPTQAAQISEQLAKKE
jgi:flagellar motility protein MotE (MotC chaperone)